MQIEQALRDLKSERFGLGLSASRSKDQHRISALLLIACLAAFALRLIGEAAKARHLERQCQSNARQSRAVLSVITLARQLVCKKQAEFTLVELNAALRHIRNCCATPSI